jgi:pseudaminic acid synthase
MNIKGREIGSSHRPFLIAEVSGNHNGSIDQALQIVDAAAAAGVDALKLQTYTADTMTIDCTEDGFVVTDKSSPWFGTSLYELYQQAETPWDWHRKIFRRAEELGLIAFSTPFDLSAVDFLEELGAPCYKIASFENTDLELIKRVARTGRPMIISTGLMSFVELDETVEVARQAGCEELALLKCTSAYPSQPDDLNLATIPHLKERYKCEVGISDHTLGIGASVAAVALGGSIIEKHLTISRKSGGVDSSFSMEPKEFAQLTTEAFNAWLSIGKIQDGPTDREVASLGFRRTLYVVEDIQLGERITLNNIRAIRPGRGLAPKYLSEVLGKRVQRSLTRGTPLALEDISME